VVPAGIAVAALGLALYRLPQTSLWGDEAFSAGLVRTNPNEFAHILWSKEANMALYHVILRGWVTLATAVGQAPNEMWLRAPSIAAGLLTVVLVFLLGQRFLGDRTAATTAAALYATNYLVLAASGEVRAYSLQLLLLTASWYALLAAWDRPQANRWWWVAYAGVTAAALYTHLFSALVLASQLVAVALPLLQRGRSAAALTRARHMAAAVAGVCILLLPMVADVLQHGPPNVHVPPANLSSIARTAWNMTNHSLVMAALVGVLVAFAIFRAWAGRNTNATPEAGHSANRRWEMITALSSWMLVPIVLSVAFTQRYLNLHLFSYIYLVVAIAPMCLLAGAGMQEIKATWMRTVIAIALVASIAQSLPWYYSSLQKQDFRSTSAWMAARYQPGDGLVCSSWSCSLGINYYSTLDPPIAGIVDDKAPGRWSWSTLKTTPLEPASLSSYASAHNRVFLVVAILQADTSEMKAQAGEAQAWLNSNGSVVATMTAHDSYFGPVTITLYQLR
jgi:hypothetical protein